MKKPHDWNKFGAWVIVAILIGLFGLGFLAYITLLNRVAALENEVSGHSNIEMQSMIDYLREERSYLIWMLGVILAGVSGILTFLGLRTRKDVESVITEKYEKAFQERLQGAVEKERVAKNKKMLFIYQPGESDKVCPTEEFFRVNGYLTQCVAANYLSFREEAIERRIEDSSIVIYQTEEPKPDGSMKPAAEQGNSSAPATVPVNAGRQQTIDTRYLTIAKICYKHRKYFIVFTSSTIDNQKLSQYDTATTANFPYTLREHLFSLLYFAP